jgi:hypothetical protein
MLRKAKGPVLPALVLCSMQQAAPAEGNPSEATVEDATEGMPTTKVKIRGMDALCALDPIFADFVVVNPHAAKRLGLDGLPFGRSGVSIDGAIIKGKVARFSMGIGHNEAMTTAALFSRSHSPGNQKQEYDVAGGFEALPVDYIVVQLNNGISGSLRDIVFSKASNDKMDRFPVTIHGTEMRIAVQFINPGSWLGARAAQYLVDDRWAVPTGEVMSLPVWFDLQMNVQQIELAAPLQVNGLQLTSLFARTTASLKLREPDDSVIMVSGQRRNAKPPMLMIGREAFKHCLSMTYERIARRMTRRCREIQQSYLTRSPIRICRPGPSIEIWRPSIRFKPITATAPVP